MLCPISGGNWNNTTNAGAWALNLNNARANSNNNVGARADLAAHLMIRRDGVEQRETFSGHRRNLQLAAFLVARRERQAAAL